MHGLFIIWNAIHEFVTEKLGETWPHMHEAISVYCQAAP